MDTIHNLQACGYAVKLCANHVHLIYVGMGLPDLAAVRPLIAELRGRKEDALRFLRAEASAATAAIVAGTPVTPTLLAPSPALLAAMRHPAYQPEVPIGQQADEVEAVWAAVAFAGLGRSDPGAKGEE